jgi:hypothetical protein
MGSEDFYAEERPVHPVSVDGFWMDRFAVTVADFRRFVQATRYVTAAERPPRAADYPGVDPRLLVPGSLVFRKASGPVRLDDFRNWWEWVPGACWTRPEGPGSHLQGRARHPITHVAFEDALAYAEWTGKTLPTEAERAELLPALPAGRPAAADDRIVHLAHRLPVHRPSARIAGFPSPAGPFLAPVQGGRPSIGVSARCFVTGETRPYDRAAGLFGRMKPLRRLSFRGDGQGTWELVARG